MPVVTGELVSEFVFNSARNSNESLVQAGQGLFD